MRRLSDQPNTPVSADFPNGRIQDDTGAGDGTPINEAVNGDIIQFFQKLIIDAGITENLLPDSVTNGYQLVEALENKINDLISPYKPGILFTFLNPSPNIEEVSYRKINDVVYVHMLPDIGAPSGTSLFTLGAAHRPQKDLRIPLGKDGEIVIFSLTGNVVLSTTPTNFKDIAGIRYRYDFSFRSDNFSI